VTQLTGLPTEAALAARVDQLSTAQQASAPLFLPYLGGERTPHNNPDASGVFVGLRSDHGAADLGYAVMEGVSFGLADGLHAMGQTGPSDTALALVGGGARNDTWAQLLASVLHCPLHRPLGAHAAAALGAARLAWLADGGSEAQVCQALPLQQAFVPSAAQSTLLAGRHARFKALYLALKDLF
jgi:xylulokinase